jgi:Icc-related predicted phosphoesterase
MNILAVSDEIVSLIYSPTVRRRFSDADLIISCGDLPYYYQDYMVSLLDIPLFFVHGNHDAEVEYNILGRKKQPGGGTDLHRNSVNYEGLLMSGVEGCIRYRRGPFQYTQGEMWWHVLSLVPDLLVNRFLYGRFLDIFVSHAPPRGIHDQTDLPHHGVNAFRWLIDVFQPVYHLHGHIHVYRPEAVTETQVGKTRVVNSYGYREICLDI